MGLLVFVVVARITPTGIPTLGDPFTPGHAAGPADWHRWALRVQGGSLSTCLEPSDARLSASNAVGVCQYRGDCPKPSDGHTRALRHDSVVATPVANASRLGEPARMTREDKPSEPIVQPPRGKATLSSTLGTPMDSYLAELPIGVDTSPATDGTKVGTNPADPAKRNPVADPSPIDTEAPRTTNTRTLAHTTHS